MNKIIKWIIGLLLAFGIVLGGVFVLSFNSIVKKGLEYIGPKATLTDIRIGSSKSSLISGSIQLNDVVIGNLQGYQDIQAFKINNVKIEFDPKSLIFNKTVIHDITIDRAEVFYEKDGKSSNIDRIFDNIRTLIKGNRLVEQPSQEKSGKKLRIDNFHIKSGIVNTRIMLISDKSISTSLEEIRLTDIGTKNEQSVYESVDMILKTLSRSVSSAVFNPLKEIGKEAQDVIDKIKGMFQGN